MMKCRFYAGAVNSLDVSGPRGLAHFGWAHVWITEGLTVYKIVYIAVNEKPEVACKSLK